MQEIDKQIGIRLAAFMASQNISRAEIAAVLECKTFKVRRFESGIAGMTARQLVTVAKRLGITSAILTGEEPFSSKAAAE